MTSRITRRISDNVVWSKKTLYILEGILAVKDLEDTERTPSFIIDKFMFGFPENWEKMTKHWKEDDAWRTHMDSLCNCRKGDSLLEIVVEGIRSILHQQEARPAASKGVRFEETVSKDCQVKVALRLVKYLLGQQANRAILMAKNRDMMEELLTTCAGVQDYITRRLSFKDTSGTSPADVAEIVSVWAQLSLLLHPDTAAAWSQELLAWSEREVLAAVDTQQQGEAGPRTRDQVSLATQVLAALATAAMSGLVLGLANTADHAAKCVEWAGQLTQCGGAPFLTRY